MKKIIFLDLDGCVIVKPNRNKDYFGYLWDEDLIENLENIIEQTNADIVITSQRRTLGLKYMQDIWYYRNYPGKVVDIIGYSYISRGDDIKEWLVNHDIDKYCIIDDLVDDFYPEQYEFFIKCNTKVGLTKELSDIAIKILNNADKI